MKFLTCLTALCLIPVAAPAQDAAADKQAMNQKKLDELLHKVQDRIELDPTLGGVMVTGGKFVPKMGMPGEDLHLEGKLMDQAVQGPKIKMMVEKALGEDPYWRESEGPLTVVTDTMTQSEGSLQLANRYYAKGLEHFWNKEFAEADRAFSRAMAEAPTDDVIRYWDAVTTLAQQQDDRAKEKLAPLLATYPLGSRTPTIATGFERLQGPLRLKLMSIENELLASM